MADEKKIQGDYYAKIAKDYDKMHLNEHDNNHKSLIIMKRLLSDSDFKSVLDVGCGTGRAIDFFLNNFKGKKVQGIEPVKELINEGIKKGLNKKHFILGSGEKLPFKKDSFDVVLETATLHHVKKPEIVVKEMARVAKKAIFISDSNRFAQGSMLMRIAKLFIYKIGLWNLAFKLLTGGKGYTITKGDGLAYSYSVYDSLSFLHNWADEVFLIPLSNSKRQKKIKSWFTPLLTHDKILLCALKK